MGALGPMELSLGESIIVQRNDCYPLRESSFFFSFSFSLALSSAKPEAADSSLSVGLSCAARKSIDYFA